MNGIIGENVTKTAQISLISFFIYYKDKMNENIIHKRKVLEQQGEIEWENYQADVELAIENH
jgi:hypothetical protein